MIGGIICCPGDEIRKRLLVWELPLLLSPLAASFLFVPSFLFLSYNFCFPPKVTSTIIVNACHQLQALLINSCASPTICFCRMLQADKWQSQRNDRSWIRPCPGAAAPTRSVWVHFQLLDSSVLPVEEQAYVSGAAGDPAEGSWGFHFANSCCWKPQIS